IQQSSITAEVGKSIQLQCEVSGYNINDHHIHWVRKSPGEETFVWLAAFKTGQTTYISNSFKDRVTPSTSGSTALLKIDKLVKSDTGVYYCARSTQQGSFSQVMCKT
uniref:Ig-like domain-containing protein n=1 Tax=Leptobrachium leishanense TaxID=445787 RepID=A0A8C5MCP6_9ANUR